MATTRTTIQIQLDHHGIRREEEGLIERGREEKERKVRLQLKEVELKGGKRGEEKRR